MESFFGGWGVLKTSHWILKEVGWGQDRPEKDRIILEHSLREGNYGQFSKTNHQAANQRRAECDKIQ